MSEREKIILEYIKQSWIRRLRSPSIREICTACGISSTSAVVYCLDKLEELGKIERRRGTRGIIVVGMRINFDEVPA